MPLEPFPDNPGVVRDDSIGYVVRVTWMPLEPFPDNPGVVRDDSIGYVWFEGYGCLLNHFKQS